MRTIGFLLLALLAACSPVEGDLIADTSVEQDDTGNSEDTGSDTDVDTADTEDTGVVNDPAVDDDGDGYSEEEGDCDDGNLWIGPDAPDLVGDGIDQNCDGVDGTDLDRDGYASTITGGTDCDDGNDAIYPGATEIWYDGIDQDCNGESDFDQDYDGYAVPEDCNDTDITICPGCEEAWNDGIDNDCDSQTDEFYVEQLWDSSSQSMVLEIEFGDPNGHHFGIYQTGGWDRENCQPGNVCHSLGYEGGTIGPAYGFVEDGLTFFDDPTLWPLLTYVLYDSTMTECWTWGYEPAYFTALGCTEYDPTPMK